MEELKCEDSKDVDLDEANSVIQCNEDSRLDLPDNINLNEGVISISDDQEECTIFHHVTYLGGAQINAPRSEKEIQRNMALLNDQSLEQAIEIAVSVPSTSEGWVTLYDSLNQAEMIRFRIHRILFFARGAVNSKEDGCFAFTCSHGESQEMAIFQCHVFRCDIPEAVGRVFMCFAKAFQCLPRVPDDKIENEHSKISPTSHSNAEEFLFEVILEIREDDGKGTFNAVPKDRSFFKLRSGLEKKLILTVQQVSTNSMDLVIERCFGLLISPGRNVKHSDMQLIEMVSMGTGPDEKKSYVIWGHWDPNDPTFEVLNQETPKDRQVFMTIAVDLVIKGIQEPIRFTIETRAKIFPQNERFWYFSKKVLVQQFALCLIESVTNGEHDHEVLSLETTGELDRNHLSLTLNLANFIHSPSIQSIETPKDDDDSDNDEPIQSGMGGVQKECSEGDLESWSEVLTTWTALGQRPKNLATLVRQGIPDALRGEVWQRLAECENDLAMMEAYRTLLTKECSSEDMILRDINRTFPAHDFFKENGGGGQDSLFKVSKAYSIYDLEIGYCQGLSFLGATLLLHIPEEQAFCVMVKIMYDYGLRVMFKDGFENLHLKLYQLDRLQEDLIPDLWLHFVDLGVESHMYGSQWFLTLFTAKFPLSLVFHILDLFMLQGIDTVFQVALALLTISKKDLLALDFEGVLRYFRVTLPKKFRNGEAAKTLATLACTIKVKKLKKYEREYLLIKEQENNPVDPLARITRENKRLVDDNMRLEVFIKELVFGKAHAEEKAESFSDELQSAETRLREISDEKNRLELEAGLVKEMLQKELLRNGQEGKRNESIITEYKQICSQLSRRLEEEQTISQDALNIYKAQVSSCEHCSAVCKQDLSSNNKMKQNAGASLQVENPNFAKQLQDLELDLAETKVALAESECRNQDLAHQLNLAVSEIESSKNRWLWKTLAPFKEAAAKKDIPTGIKNMSRKEIREEISAEVNKDLKDSTIYNCDLKS